MWKDVEKGFQTAFQMAWEAFKAGTMPIGAAILNADGDVISAARNQCSSAGKGLISNHTLAHAEINAILMVSEDKHPDIRTYTIYTTTEPCPLCFGAIVMGTIRKAKFAQRDPWAGTAELNGRYEYSSVIKKITMDGPFSDEEAVQLGLFVCHHTDLFKERKNERFIKKYESVFGNLIPAAVRMAESGEVARFAESGAGIEEVYDFILTYLTKGA
jgi:tRNA(adenine34) deaminase